MSLSNHQKTTITENTATTKLQSTPLPYRILIWNISIFVIVYTTDQAIDVFFKVANYETITT